MCVLRIAKTPSCSATQATLPRSVRCSTEIDSECEIPQFIKRVKIAFDIELMAFQTEIGNNRKCNRFLCDVNDDIVIVDRDFRSGEYIRKWDFGAYHLSHYPTPPPPCTRTAMAVTEHCERAKKRSIQLLHNISESHRIRLVVTQRAHRLPASLS